MRDANTLRLAEKRSMAATKELLGLVTGAQFSELAAACCRGVDHAVDLPGRSYLKACQNPYSSDIWRAIAYVDKLAGDVIGHGADSRGFHPVGASSELMGELLVGQGWERRSVSRYNLDLVSYFPPEAVCRSCPRLLECTLAGHV